MSDNPFAPWKTCPRGQTGTLPVLSDEAILDVDTRFRISDVYYFLKRHGSFWLCRFLFRTGLYKYVPGVKLCWYVDKPYGCYFG